MIRQENASAVTQRSVLILDFHNDFSGVAKEITQQHWVATTASTLSHAMRIIRQTKTKVAVAIISLNKHKAIFEAIDKLQNIEPELQWLAISMQHPIKSTAYSENLSAYFVDYFHCPIDWIQFTNTLGHLWGMTQLQQRQMTTAAPPLHAEIMFGTSDKLMQLNSDIKKIANVDSSVLISGETGTGKDLSAQLIHNKSARKNGPFINVNCGALPGSLIHSELFGHEKGAYTGAIDKYIGHIERANKGTLFLDEIGDLPLELQVNLLHFLETHTIERLGSSSSIKVDCRVLAATHIDLENAIAEGHFRKDLFHRLNILRLRVPSLREHREDIEIIANKFLAQHQKLKTKLAFSDSAIECMLTYDWPGNVRELKNRVERAVVMVEGNSITEHDLGHHLAKTKNSMANLNQQRAEIDAEILLDAITRNNHNISAAARELNISRTTLYRMIKRCKIEL